MSDGAIWTEANVATLRRMWEERASVREIAHAIGGGLTRNAVLGKAHRMKLGSHTPVFIKAKKARHATHPIKLHKQQPMRAPNMLDSIPIEPVRISAAAWTPLPGTVPVPLVDLERGQCKWPCSDGSPFMFCGQPALADHPYCEHHTRRAAGPPQPKMKAPGKW